MTKCWGILSRGNAVIQSPREPDLSVQAIILQAGILKIKWAIEVYVYLMLKLILFATNKQTGTIVNRVITKQAARSKTEHTENSDF